MSDVTHFLAAIEQGDPHAAAQLLRLVYDELRRLAAAQMAREKPGQMLRSTGQLCDKPLGLEMFGQHSQPYYLIVARSRSSQRSSEIFLDGSQHSG
jgi:hypothetical protein